MNRSGSGCQVTASHVFVVLALTIATHSANAQSIERQSGRSSAQSPAVAVAAGLIHWDLSGTGSSPYVALRGDAPLGTKWVLGEIGVGYFSTDEQFGQRRSYVVPEAQVHFQWPMRIASPYVGVGGGWFRGSGGGESRAEVTTSVAAGLRLALAAFPLGMRAELRVRGIGTDYSGSAAEWTAGASWRF